MMPRVKDLTVSNLAEGTYSAPYTPMGRQRYYLHNLGIPDLQISIWQSLWNRIQATGAVFAFFIGIYAIVMLCIRTMRYVFIGAAPDGQSWGQKLLSICCPTFIAAFRYYTNTRRRFRRATRRPTPPAFDEEQPPPSNTPNAPSPPQSPSTYRKVVQPRPPKRVYPILALPPTTTADVLRRATNLLEDWGQVEPISKPTTIPLRNQPLTSTLLRPPKPTVSTSSFTSSHASS